MACGRGRRREGKGEREEELFKEKTLRPVRARPRAEDSSARSSRLKLPHSSEHDNGVTVMNDANKYTSWMWIQCTNKKIQRGAEIKQIISYIPLYYVEAGLLRKHCLLSSSRPFCSEWFFWGVDAARAR